MLPSIADSASKEKTRGGQIKHPWETTANFILGLFIEKSQWWGKFICSSYTQLGQIWLKALNYFQTIRIPTVGCSIEKVLQGYVTHVEVKKGNSADARDICAGLKELFNETVQHQLLLVSERSQLKKVESYFHVPIMFLKWSGNCFRL